MSKSCHPCPTDSVSRALLVPFHCLHSPWAAVAGALQDSQCFLPHDKERGGALHFWGLISLLKYRVWLGLSDNSGGVKDSAPSREIHSARKVLVPVGAGSPLLLAVISCILFPETHVHKAAAVPSSLLLLLLLGTSQPCTGFLSVLLVLVCIPAAPCSLPACLGRAGWGVLMPLPWCMNANNLV